MHKDRVNNQLEKIRTWKNMVTKVKEKFLPFDYQHNLFRQVQNLNKGRHLFTNTLKSSLCYHSEKASRNHNSNALQGMKIG
jgi:hypothetical protein